MSSFLSPKGDLKSFPNRRRLCRHPPQAQGITCDGESAELDFPLGLSGSSFEESVLSLTYPKIANIALFRVYQSGHLC